MTRTLLVLGITLAAALPAKADLQHKIMSSVQLQVGGAVTNCRTPRFFVQYQWDQY